MANLPLPIIVNFLAMVPPVLGVLKEKHYVKRSTTVSNGVGLIVTGVALLISNQKSYLFSVPLATFPLVLGVAGILMTSTKMDYWEIVGRSLTTLIVLLITLLVQFGAISF